MKQKQRVALLGIAAVALIFTACDGDSGNNSTETEGNSSSSSGIYSSGGQMNSSPVVNSSSSSVAACTNTYGTNTVTDCRDGQSYKTVVIGTQTWMAENLNYAVDSSWCYENSADSCAKYGRLYTWTAAMGVSATYNDAVLGDSVKHQGVCPAGWHIPTNAEWTTLETAVGGEDVAGAKLKSASGWYKDGNGTDAYGFSALPAGDRILSGDFISVGLSTDFWSTTEGVTDNAYYRCLIYNYASMIMDDYLTFAISVRCVQD